MNGADGPVVGFVGLGNLGLPMAANLARHFRLGVYDVRAQAVSEAVEHGATAFSDLPSLAAQSAVVCIAVVNDQQVHDVLLSNDGLKPGFHAGLHVVVHSTVAPLTILELSERVKDRGVIIVDAAVTGADVAAWAGELTVMAGGDISSVDRVMPILETIGSRVFRVGPIGSGAAAKLVNNLMGQIAQLATLEAMQLAAAHGISEDIAREIGMLGSGDSWSLRNWGHYDRIMQGHTLAGTPEMYRYLAKDLWLACSAAQEAGLDLPLTAVASQLYGPMQRARYEALGTDGTARLPERGEPSGS